MKLKGFVFDFDGTLANTLPVCYIAFRQVLYQYQGKEYTDKEIASLFGPTETGIFKRLFPDCWEECVENFLMEYRKAHESYAKPFSGIEEVLKILTQRHVRLGIVSGKGNRSMDISLTVTKLGHFFDTIITGSEEKADKPTHIRQVLTKWGFPPGQVAYVGDTPYDIKASKEVGLMSVGVVWAKTSDRESMTFLKPDAIFSSVDNFIGWIEKEVEPNTD